MAGGNITQSVGIQEVNELGDNLRELFEEDPLFFGKVYVPGYFTLETPEFHEKILAESLGSRFLAIQCPRGSAKSTLLSFLRVFHGICFKKFRFIVIVQNTQKKAEGTLDGIKKEFIDNGKVMRDFRVVMTKSAAHDTVFRHKDGYETRVLCFGQEQIGSIRGERFGPYRPDLIIIDDLEDDELVKNPDRRQDLKFLYDDALIPAGDYEKLRVFAIGTLLHHDSLIARLVSADEYLEYRKLFFMALYKGAGGEECSLWPEKWTVEDLRKMRDEKPSTFAKEMQGNPTSGYMRRFDAKDFRYWAIKTGDYVCYDPHNNTVERGSLKDCKAAVGIDLGWEEKRQSDDSVLVPCLLTPNNALLVDDYIAEKGMRPDKLIQLMYALDKKYSKMTGDTVIFGFEKAKLEKVSRWYIKKDVRRTGHALIMRSIPWGTDKIERITTRLQPMYSMHMIYHKRGMGKLEQQLIQFPEGTHDDICFSEGTKIATLFGYKNIENIIEKDLIITPFGIRKAICSKPTGISETINLETLVLTPNHKVFSKKTNCFVSANMIKSSCILSKLNYKEVLKWKYQKLLSSMEQNIKEWEGRKSIILVNQIPIKEEKILKDFMWRFGNLIIKLKFLKALKFIIKMVIILITHQIIWNVFLLGNIVNCMLRFVSKNLEKASITQENLHQSGINQKREENGIVINQKNNGRILEKLICVVKYVVLNLFHIIKTQNIVHKNAEIEKSIGLRKVYNLTIEKDGVYYANDILVSNCDALQEARYLLTTPRGKKKKRVEDDAFEKLRKFAIEKKQPFHRQYVFGKKATPFPFPHRTTPI